MLVVRKVSEFNPPKFLAKKGRKHIWTTNFYHEGLLKFSDRYEGRDYMKKVDVGRYHLQDESEACGDWEDYTVCATGEE